MENTFKYSYSAKENSELLKIRKKYEPQTIVESKTEQVKKLDNSVEAAGMTGALVLGIIGALILGVGMCCTMVWTDLFILGIFVGIIGMIMCGLAYPLYNRIVRNKRAEIAPQILKLTEEIEMESKN